MLSLNHILNNKYKSESNLSIFTANQISKNSTAQQLVRIVRTTATYIVHPIREKLAQGKTLLSHSAADRSAHIEDVMVSRPNEPRKRENVCETDLTPAAR